MVISEDRIFKRTLKQLISDLGYSVELSDSFEDICSRNNGQLDMAILCMGLFQEEFKDLFSLLKKSFNKPLLVICSRFENKNIDYDSFCSESGLLVRPFDINELSLHIKVLLKKNDNVLKFISTTHL